MGRKKLRVSEIFQTQVSCAIEANGFLASAQKSRILPWNLNELASNGYATKKTLKKARNTLVTPDELHSISSKLSEDEVNDISLRVKNARKAFEPIIP